MRSVRSLCTCFMTGALSLIFYQHSFAECGIASTYSSVTITASGERYNEMGVSAAHKSLPFGTRVVVRNQKTGRSITVRINDRGPFIEGRIIDLSTGAKNALGMDDLTPVCIEVESYGSANREFQIAQLPQVAPEAARGAVLNGPPRDAIKARTSPRYTLRTTRAQRHGAKMVAKTNYVAAHIYRARLGQSHPRHRRQALRT